MRPSGSSLSRRQFTNLNLKDVLDTHSNAMSKRWFLMVFLWAIRVALCSRDNEKAILDAILAPDSYDSRLRPPSDNDTAAPTVVTVNLFVRTISSIDDTKMQYNVQLTFRQQWLDKRLNYIHYSSSVKYLTLTKAKLLWTPDLFFSNEDGARSHDLMTPNLFFRIFPNGQVLHSRSTALQNYLPRISLTLNCPMDLKSYPLDNQVCTIRMASFGYLKEDVRFVWKTGDPVQVVRNLYVPYFSLQKIITDNCESRTNTGEYSCITVSFIFKREIFQYLLRVYIPSTMMVLIGFSIFWIDPAAVTARLTLSFLTLTVLAGHASMVTASLSPVSYATSLNTWLGVCVTFAFAAFLESVTVHYLTGAGSSSSSSSDRGAEEAKSTGKGETKCTLRQQFNKLNCFRSCSQRFNVQPKRVDVVARISFLVLFVVFNLIYWLPLALSYD